MTVLQQFKELMTVGNTIGSVTAYGEQPPRIVAESNTVSFGITTRTRSGKQVISYQPWPKAKHLRKEGDRFIINDGYSILRYWRER
jgi:hypothetical protein